MHASRAVVLSLLLAMHDMMPPLCPCMHARPPTSTWTDRDVSAYMAMSSRIRCGCHMQVALDQLQSTGRSTSHLSFSSVHAALPYSCLIFLTPKHGQRVEVKKSG
jgi:hypothetical protein